MVEVWLTADERYPEYDIDRGPTCPEVCVKVIITETDLSDFEKAKEHWLYWQKRLANLEAAPNG